MPKFIVAYPATLRTFETQAEAEAFADAIRDYNHVKIYEATERAHLFPRGKPGPKDPGPPGTPAAAVAKAA